jgi:hypothetical protein
LRATVFSAKARSSSDNVSPNIPFKHLTIIGFAGERPAFDLAIGVADVQPGIEQRDPGPVFSGTRDDQITAVQAFRMARREPVTHLVFRIEARQRHDTVNMFPLLAHTRLQGQLASDPDQPHHLMRRFLFDIH